MSDFDVIELGMLIRCEGRDTPEDVPASLRLVVQQVDIFRECLRQIGPAQLSAHHDDRGERRAEFVRGGGGQPVKTRKMILSFQNQFGGREGEAQVSRFMSDLRGVGANECGRDQKGGPVSQPVEQRQFEDFPGTKATAGDKR